MKMFSGIAEDIFDGEAQALLEKEREEDLKKTPKKALIPKNKEYKDKIIRLVKDFKDNNTILEEYKSMEIKYEAVLLRIFKFTPGTSDSNATGILVPDFNGGFVDSSNFRDSVITPIAKVIKVHESLKDRFKVGELVLLDFEKVRGWIPNPEMQLYMQSLEAKGVEAVEPEDTRPKIPRIEAMWRDYMFLRPWLFEPEEEDRLTYLLPTYEIKGGWDLETYLTT